MVANAPDQQPQSESQPDPLAADPNMGPGPHLWFRYALGTVLLAGLLTCVILGIYRVIEALNQPA